MDFDAVARGRRRGQALEALEAERDREAALRSQLEETITELEGPRIDEEALARLAPEDADIVRAAFGEQAGLEPESELGEELGENWLDLDEPDPEAERAELLAEIARLEHEIADSRRRQQALERYLEAIAAPAEP